MKSCYPMENYYPTTFDQKDINRLYSLIDFIFRKRKDKAGSPYINHLAFVAHNAYRFALEYSRGLEFADICYIVGLCHDVVEDCDVDEIDAVFDMIECLWGADSSTINGAKPIIDAINVLTRQEGEKYSEYFKRVSEHPVGRVVKCADALHNSDITRFDQEYIDNLARKGDLDDLVKRCKKYHKRYEKLYALFQKDKSW